VCAKHDVLQQIADATTATTSSTSSGSRRPSGRRSMDGTSSSTGNGVVMSAPGTLSDAADCTCSDAASTAAAATSASTATAADSSASSGSSSRRTQSMDLAKMLSGGWNPVTGTDKQSGESLLTVVADVADEETAEIEPAETVVTLATAREAAHSTDTESEHVVVPLPPAATTTAVDADTAGTAAGVSLPAVPTSDDSSSTASTTAARKRSDAPLATDTFNSSSSSSSSLRVNSSVFSSSSGAPATPSRSAGPCVSSLVQARTAAEAEAASKRAAAVSERLASAQYKESGARGQCLALLLKQHLS
jgi:hypothetical protein